MPDATQLFSWIFSDGDFSRNRVLINPPNAVSVLCLNSVLLESAPSMAERYLAETTTVIRQGISSKNVRLIHDEFLCT
jgi:hypothetical protein